MQKVLLVVGVLLAVVAAIGFVFRAPIAVRVAEAGVTQNFTRNAIEELPDGLHVALCGAGGPLVDPRRAGPCVAVIAGRTMFVVDAGTGGVRNLTRMGLPPGQIVAVFLTHFHSDHIDGLGELSLQRWTGSAATAPLPVYGAQGVVEVVGGFNQAYRLDVGYRTAHHGETATPASGAGMMARPFVLPAMGQSSVLWERDGAKITVFAVEHEPVVPAVGYRFDYGGRSAVVSGDTHKSANLVEFAKGADLLVHEALSTELVGMMQRSAAAAGRNNIAKIMQDIPDYHTSPVEAAEVAAEAGIGHLLLYHVIPPLVVPGLETAFLAGVNDVYRGDVTLGRDGVTVSMRSGAEAVDVGMRL